nr:DUF6789 family protein [Paraburkholderia sp.]
MAMMAGFVATVVLSLLMVMKGAMGIMPALNPVAMLSTMANAKMGLPETPMVGWLAHFMIGTVAWGILFALLYRLLPGYTPLRKGMSFSVLAWIMMMVGPMPMAGAGLFGLNLGIMAPVMTLVLHLIWGATLGFTFGQFERQCQLRHGSSRA